MAWVTTSSFFRLPSSVFRLPSSFFRLPSSFFLRVDPEKNLFQAVDDIK
jgi:hypothetical protein